VKADLSGAMIEVVNSTNTSLIGVKGIVCTESQRTFVIVNEKNEQKIILKKDSVFEVQLPIDQEQLAVQLYGDMLLYKGSERTKAKYKEKGRLALY
jgi:RNase P/RNase MRP subunit p29